MRAGASPCGVPFSRVLSCQALCLVALLVVLAPPSTLAQEQPTLNAPAAFRFAEAGTTNEPLAPGTPDYSPTVEPRDSKAPLVLMAISGGGSRAAYYTACVMELLQQVPAAHTGGSVMDSVRVISSVSGGSFAAGYYTMNFDGRHTPGFFEQYKNAMATNLQWKSYGNMALFPPLAFQLAMPGVTRTNLLARSIEQVMGRGRVCFADLRAQESRAQQPAPILLLNGTVYNSGQRIVFTNLGAAHFPTLSTLNPDGVKVTLPEQDAETYQQLLQPMTFADIGSDISSFHVSNAIAASAAYPLILAPYRVATYPQFVPPSPKGHFLNRAILESPYIYVADGGVYENNGTDALLSLLRTVPRSRPVIIIAIDASQRMELIKTETRTKVWGAFTVVPRMYDIGTLRAFALSGAVLNDIRDPANTAVVAIRMHSRDPQREALLKKIPTIFKISKKSREVLAVAAYNNVSELAPEISNLYARFYGKGGGKSRSRSSAR
jgi:hypothetical protein